MASKPMVAVLEEPESGLLDALRAMRVVWLIRAEGGADGKCDDRRRTQAVGVVLRGSCGLAEKISQRPIGA